MEHIFTLMIALAIPAIPVSNITDNTLVIENKKYSTSMACQKAAQQLNEDVNKVAKKNLVIRITLNGPDGKPITGNILGSWCLVIPKTKE